MPFVLGVLCTNEVLKPVPNHISTGLSKQVGKLSSLARIFFFSPSPKLLKSSTIHDLDLTGTALVLSL